MCESQELPSFNYTNLYNFKKQIRMLKLIILFLVGLGMCGIPAYIIISEPSNIVDNVYLVIVAGIGGALMLIAGTKALKKANNYLDR